MKNADIEKRDYDVFRVWGVDEKGLSVPEGSTDETLIPDAEDEENKVVASVFGNEYIPLVMQARDRGIDISDRFEVSRWLSSQAEELNDQSYRDWAVYSEKMSDDDWRMFIGQYLGDNRVAMKTAQDNKWKEIGSQFAKDRLAEGADKEECYNAAQEWARDLARASGGGDIEADEVYEGMLEVLGKKKTAADVGEAVDYMQSFVEPTSPNEEVEKAFNQVVREMNLSDSEQAEMRMLLGELGYWGGFEVDAAKKTAEDAPMGLGPGGKCVCPTCGYRDEHDTGVPCFERTCPKCGESMTRVASLEKAADTGDEIASNLEAAGYKITDRNISYEDEPYEAFYGFSLLFPDGITEGALIMEPSGAWELFTPLIGGEVIASGNGVPSVEELKNRV